MTATKTIYKPSRARVISLILSHTFAFVSGGWCVINFLLALSGG